MLTLVMPAFLNAFGVIDMTGTSLNSESSLNVPLMVAGIEIGPL